MLAAAGTVTLPLACLAPRARRRRPPQQSAAALLGQSVAIQMGVVMSCCYNVP